MYVGIAILIMKKSKGAFKRWELMVMTLVIVSGIVIDYANVTIVINISGQQWEKITILRPNMPVVLHPTDYHMKIELKD